MVAPVDFGAASVAAEGSQEGYCKWACHGAAKKGWRAVVFNMRGCNGLPLSTGRGYSAIMTPDLRLAIDSVQARFPTAPICAVGYSLGALAMTKYVSEADRGLRLAQPWTIAYIYNLAVAFKLREYIKLHRKTILDHASMDTGALLSTWTLREFEEQSLPMQFNYLDRQQYYEEASSLNYFPHIKTPTLILVSEDDPFLGVLPDIECSSNPSTLLVATKHGGHVAFLQGMWPLENSFMDDAVLEFCGAVVQHTRCDGGPLTPTGPVPSASYRGTWTPTGSVPLGSTSEGDGDDIRSLVRLQDDIKDGEVVGEDLVASGEKSKSSQLYGQAEQRTVRYLEIAAHPLESGRSHAEASCEGLQRDGSQAEAAGDVLGRDGIQAEAAGDVQGRHGSQAKASCEGLQRDRSQAEAAGDVQGRDGSQTEAAGDVQGSHGSQAEAAGDVQGSHGSQAEAAGDVQGSHGSQAEAAGDVQGSHGSQAEAAGDVQGSHGSLAEAAGDVQGRPGSQAEACSGMLEGGVSQAEACSGMLKGDGSQSEPYVNIPGAGGSHTEAARSVKVKGSQSDDESSTINGQLKQQSMSGSNMIGTRRHRVNVLARSKL
eukprot:gene14332-20321_t